MANMAQRSASKVFDLDPIDQPDKYDEEMGRSYEEFLSSTSTMSTNELHAYVHNTAAARVTMLALLYSVLTDRTKAEPHFELLRVSNRDNYATILRQLEHFIESAYFPRMKADVRRQLLWMVDRLSAANVTGVEILHLQLLRQMPGGDVHPSTTVLCKYLLDLCETHRMWLESRPRVLHMYVYTFLRIIPDHRATNLIDLQQSEINLVVRLIRNNWITCCAIGRDLIRALQDVSKIPEFAQLLSDMLERPETLHKNFEGVITILSTQTPPELLRYRLTPQMELSLRWIFDKLTPANYQRNLEWFAKRWLSTPLAESFYADVIRYIVAGWYPSNELLQSDKVPRYVVVGTLFTYIKSHVVAANVKLSLFLDWMFFTPDANIMLIEPAILLMERSIKHHPYITVMLVEFLRFAVDAYHPRLSDHILKSVGIGMKELLRKGVIKRLITIYQYPTMEDVTRQYLMDMFAASLDFTGNARSNTPQRNDADTVALAVDATSITEKNEAFTDSTTDSTMDNTNTIPVISEGEDQELDEYLYGIDRATTDNTALQFNSAEDEIMTEVKDSIASNNSPQMESTQEFASTPGVEIPDMGTIRSEEMDLTSGRESSYDKYTESEDSSSSSDEEDQIQQQQSFWMFADLLTRFQDASKTIKDARSKDDIDEMQAHSYICKKNLREILNTYLKMKIPGKNLAPSLAKYIRQSSCAQYDECANRTVEPMSLNQEEVLHDASMDSIDLMFISLWQLQDLEAQKKMIDFISCVMHLSKKGGKHLIGMRWWQLFARKLQEQRAPKSLSYPDWCRSAWDQYQSMVSQYLDGHIDDTALMPSNAQSLKQYLIEDLRLLKDYKILAVQDVSLVLFTLSPDLFVGDRRMISLLVSSVLPEKIPLITSQLSCGHLEVIGEQNMGSIIINTLKWETFEQIVFWRLLQAEIAGCQDKIIPLMNVISSENLLEYADIPELLTALPTVIATIPPTAIALKQLISMLPQMENLPLTVTTAIIEILQRWTGTHKHELQDCLIEAVDELLSGLQVEDNEEIQRVGKHWVTIFEFWWKMRSPQNNEVWSTALLSKLIPLADAAQHEVPLGWRDLIKKTKKRQAIAVFSDSD